ncbi:MAG: SURF1 family protein [Tetrasphaera sp.]
MIRALLTPRWLGALLLSALFAVAAYHLGHWQYGRYVTKHDRNDRIAAHLRADPVPLDGLLGAGPMPIEREWTHVRVQGTYAAPELLVRNRTLDGTNGYEVLTPLDLGDGRTLLVDRGWVSPSGAGAATLPAVTAAPAGPQHLVGWLRGGERSRGKALPTGQLASIDLAEAAAQVGRPVLGGYLQLDGPIPDTSPLPQNSAPQLPRPLGRPDTSLGPHQAYAYQWWVSMPLGFVLVFFGLRRELAAGRDADASDQATTPAKTPTAAKPKKVRIWDEEDA